MYTIVVIILKITTIVYFFGGCIMKLKKITGLLTAIIIALSTFMVCGISVGAKFDDFANTVWEYDAAKVYGLTFTICKNEIKE